MYCLCSDSSFDDILSRQRNDPLPLDQMIKCYTRCNSGCGTCIPALRAEAALCGLDPAVRSVPAVEP